MDLPGKITLPLNLSTGPEDTELLIVSVHKDIEWPTDTREDRETLGQLLLNQHVGPLTLPNGCKITVSGDHQQATVAYVTCARHGVLMEAHNKVYYRTFPIVFDDLRVMRLEAVSYRWPGDAFRRLMTDHSQLPTLHLN